MKDPKEQKLIEARDEASLKLVEAHRKWVDAKRDEWVEAHREWVEAERKLRKYQESKAQQGGQAGE